MDSQEGRRFCRTSRLGQWLHENGGHFHEALYFEHTPDHGTGVFTSSSLDPNAELVSCPFSLSINSASCRSALKDLGFSSALLDKWNEHQCLGVYLALHLAFPPPAEGGTKALKHHAYIQSLPRKDEMMTPPWWAEEERALLKGTNLGVSTKVRTDDWKNEHRDILAGLETEMGLLVDKELLLRGLSWESYLPSSQVLFPGVDSLNHHRATPITWSLSSSSITLVPSGTAPLEENAEVFNTYGPKSTDSFILGYGFVPSPHTTEDDLLSLQIPLPDPSLQDALFALGFDKDYPTRFLIPITGDMPEDMLKLLRLLLVTREDGDMEEEEEERSVREWAKNFTSTAESELPDLTFVSWYNELEMWDVLQGMLQAKQRGLEGVRKRVEENEEANVRKEVKEMILLYLKGQIEILENALSQTLKRAEETREKAKEAGVEMDEDEEMESDSSDS
ncbi:SET domain-containing protein [Atractiella rhizophila]|nr:SET domain-containing protein [Atractiella rhizophila]